MASETTDANEMILEVRRNPEASLLESSYLISINSDYFQAADYFGDFHIDCALILLGAARKMAGDSVASLELLREALFVARNTIALESRVSTPPKEQDPTGPV